ncbi:hypothetical protein LCGC14_0359810 [marine sediment metagenome]|uniref:Uncharacterized protein n=1 Tax=marine sediment metagenome TaxID=412755 RepID=A0A0F9TR56_9ZZZZ
MKKNKKMLLQCVLCLTILFCMSQILPIINFYEPSEINITTNVIENITLQEQIYSVLPSCVYIEAKVIYEGWNGESITSIRSGSGVIVSKDGLIVTAGHMVDRAIKITVRLNDGREFEAVEWQKENYTDLGLIKIDSNNLPTVLLGDSDNEFLGNQVFIIGCPFGKQLYNTVTTGIVSGLKRDIDLFGEKLLIQVDSQAWPGNSGGGLFNSNGELIGVLVGAMSGYDGISVCIPGNIVKLMLDKYNSEQDIVKAQ